MPKNSRPNSPQPVPEPHLLAALLCRRPVQRYAATSEVTLHSYPATRFARIPPAYGGRSLELAGRTSQAVRKNCPEQMKLSLATALAWHALAAMMSNSIDTLNL
jgi:hypothetical protein